MKTAAIIAEYNPFHKGHEYHISEARRITGADFVLVIMSGNFVQRGEPAVCDKYLRTGMALAGGADAVFELPVPFATGSAEYFAEGAVKMISGLNCIDYLCFGSECGDIAPLMYCAKLLNAEPEEYIFSLKRYIKAGISYPKSRALAVSDYLRSDRNCSYNETCSANNMQHIFQQEQLPCSESLDEILSLPNNILGVEYCRALLNQSSMYEAAVPVPVTIKRIGSDYNDEFISSEFSSAKSIRDTLLHEGITEELLASCPHTTAQLLHGSYNRKLPVCVDDLSALLNFKLLYAEKEVIKEKYSADKDLINSIFKLPCGSRYFSETIRILKSKRYTYTSISRMLLHLLLDIDISYINEMKADCFLPYARLLGMKKSASALLRRLQSDSNIPIITRVSDADRSNRLFQCDIRSAQLYNQLLLTRFGYSMKNEYEHSPVIF